MNTDRSEYRVDYELIETTRIQLIKHIDLLTETIREIIRCKTRNDHQDLSEKVDEIDLDIRIETDAYPHLWQKLEDKVTSIDQEELQRRELRTFNAVKGQVDERSKPSDPKALDSFSIRMLNAAKLALNNNSDSIIRALKLQAAAVKEEEVYHDVSEDQIVSYEKPPLPVLSVPIFDGSNRSEYHIFIKLFTSLIMERKGLQNTQKHLYLEGYLRGEALKVIKPYPRDGSFLSEALEALKDEYGSQKETASYIYQTIHRIRANSDRANDQIDLARELLALAQQLKNLGEDTNISCLILIDKFAPIYRRKLHESNQNTEAITMLKFLISHIRSEIQLDLASGTTDLRDIKDARQSCYDNSMNSYDHSSNQYHTSFQPRIDPFMNNGYLSNPSITPSNPFHPSHTSNTSNQSDQKKTNRQPLCVFCGKHPNPSVCRCVPMIKARTQIVQQKGLCPRCLSSEEHSNCNQSCTLCGGPHHDAICFASIAKVTGLTISVNHTDNQNTQTSRLLTAKAMISDSSQRTDRTRRKSEEIDILLDTGAQMNLISRSVVQKMGIKPSGSKVLTLSLATGVEKEPQCYDIVKVKVRKIDKSYHCIEAVVLDGPVTSAIQVRSLSTEDLNHIRVNKFRLADNPNRDGTINPQLLLGVSDTLSLIHTLSKYTLPSGLRIHDTAIGLVMGGTQSDSKSQEEQLSINQIAIINTINESLSVGKDEVDPPANNPEFIKLMEEHLGIVDWSKTKTKSSRLKSMNKKNDKDSYNRIQRNNIISELLSDNNHSLINKYNHTTKVQQNQEMNGPDHARVMADHGVQSV